MDIKDPVELVNSSGKLKPCPLCNYKSKLVQKGYNVDNKRLYHITCKGRRCIIKTRDNTDLMKLLEQWQKRDNQ